VRTLFDVSVLLPLFDPEHAHHERASAWWAEHQDEGWASCPLTQNGFIRVVSGRGYPRPMALGAAISILRAQSKLPSHEFWPDDISLMDQEVFAHGRILGPKQITDAYLLGLAVQRGGRFATFDQSIPVGAVRGAQERHVVVI
jgi:uncharacterized protein